MTTHITQGYENKRHIEEVKTMNNILELLKSYDYEAQDRILMWVQMRIEHDWDD